MLVLNRREAEKIRIGEDIEIVVVAIKGSQVQIGIRAPAHLVVDREEIYLRKRANGEVKL